MKKYLGTWFALFSFAGTPAFAQQTDFDLWQEDSQSEYEMQTENFILYSETIDQEYSVSISKPKNYSSDHNYPMVLYTDANLKYAATNLDQEMTRVLKRLVESLVYDLKIPQVVLVGIGYPSHSRNYRDRDLTPVSTRRQWIDWKNNLPRGASPGGAAEFSAFISSVLKPFIYSRVQIDRSNETYIGHSFGGLFGFFLLFNDTDLFDNYILSSPSLWYPRDPRNRRIAYSYEENFSDRNSDLAKSVYISAGSFEGAMISDGEQMYEQLQSRDFESLRLEWEVFENKGHHRVVQPAYTNGLSFIFEK